METFSPHRLYLHGTNFLSRLIAAFGLVLAHADQRLHAAAVGDALVGLGHGGDGRELLHHLVVPEGALDDHGGLPSAHTAVLPLEQLDLLVQQVLRQFVTSVKVEKRWKKNPT